MPTDTSRLAVIENELKHVNATLKQLTKEMEYLKKNNGSSGDKWYNNYKYIWLIIATLFGVGGGGFAWNATDSDDMKNADFRTEILKILKEEHIKK